MEKTRFNNGIYYWTITSILIGLILWNLYLTIAFSNLLGLLPVAIISVLVFLILTKNRFAKIGIKLWAIIFLIIASGLQFIGQLLKDVVDGFGNVDFSYYLKTGLSVSFGILIFIYANKTIDIIDVEEDLDNPIH